MSEKYVTVTQRGRPLMGEQALTAAERKRAQRMRDSRAAIDAIGAEENAPLRVLVAMRNRG